MTARNLTIQLDEDLIRRAKVLAAEQGTSLSAMVARDLRDKLAAHQRREHAMRIAFDSMVEAAGSGREAPRWTRAELYDR